MVELWRESRETRGTPIHPAEASRDARLSRIQVWTDRLNRANRIMRLNGRLAVALTMAEFLLVLSVLASGAAWLLVLTRVYVPLLSAFAIAFLVAFDMKRRAANETFQDLSDEIEASNFLAHVAANAAPDTADAAYAAAYAAVKEQARESIRAYFRVTDLPVFRGKNGPALCFALNLASALALMFFGLRI